MESLLYGRELIQSEMSKELKEAIDQEKIIPKKRASFFTKGGKSYCQRCQAELTLSKKGECICGEECAYCRNCLKMGKIRKCSPLYSLKEKNAFEKTEEHLLAWSGKLSEEQEKAAAAILLALEKKETRLLWAVTGAGKTEMLFPGIEAALIKGERVCLASPRIDVCLELAPRIQNAFPSIPLALLYGGMEEAYQYRQLTIATTHQLFRFKEAFDLLIIDEIDAFPFAVDPSLNFACQKARKELSTLIYLSATPSRKMQKEIKRGKLNASILPARYHGHPLVLPKMIWAANWKSRGLRHFKRMRFGKIIDEKIKAGKSFLLFLANIQWMLAFEMLLKESYPDAKFASVSSKDPLRKEKVVMMRKGEIQFLLTTTILERGVTFSNIDVLVLGAEEGIFTESALVQIAGRCGRAADYPQGEVLFFHDGKTIAMKRAIKQIKKMNQIAYERGLVK